MTNSRAKKKKIGIDARFYGPKGKGLGRYVQKLIEKLEETDGGSEERLYYVFLKGDNFNEYNPGKNNFKKIKADFHWYTFKEQLLFPSFLKKFNLDLMHFCHFNVPIFYSGKFIVTVHDLILFHYPTVRNTTRNKLYYRIKLFAYKKVIRSAVSRAKKVLAVSKFTKQDLIKELGISDEKIVTTQEGCDFYCHLCKQSDENILNKYAIMKPYLLYVGNAYPHKNLERLVVAFERLFEKNKKLQLVLVGGKDFFYRRLIEYVKEKKICNVVFPGFVPDEELDVLYKNARLYVFPSLYEGFGLPPLEALAKGTPVVCSSKTSMPEILDDAATYFEPEKIESIFFSIEKLLQRPRVDVFAQGRALQRIKLFSWERMAKETLAEYQKFL